MTESGVALTDTLRVDDEGWQLIESGWEADRAVAVGSNFTIGNGYLGYRGTSPEQTAADYVALVVSDTYDCADGRWRELTTAPNPLFVAARAGGSALAMESAAEVETSLDLRTGQFGARFTTVIDGAAVSVAVERLASYDDLHLMAQRWTVTSDRHVTIDLDLGIDGHVWSLNGVHLPRLSFHDIGDGAAAGGMVAIGTTGESGIDIAVASTSTITGEPGSSEVVDEPRRRLRRHQVTLDAGSPIVVETVAAVASSNDVDDPVAHVQQVVATGAAAGYDVIRAHSQTHWDRIWTAMDVQIIGDPVDQTALRFSAYHNRICTPAHTDHLPVGARGLSCQAYQGAAFWDQEFYNLPAFLYTEPELARSLLVYRHRTLDGARRKAARLGYDGAYYAWISGVTGDELCPDYFFVDVLTGRPIRNHFNVWQMHIAPDIVTTLGHYVDITGDVDYLVDHGAEIAFEVARFLRSFVRYDDWREVYHCIRLLGPDEWHENVDNNAFTNYQTQAALAFAVETYERLAADHPDALSRLQAELGVTDDEVDGWRRIRDRMFLPVPDGESGLIEQFDGFFQLEDTTPDVVRSRLLDPGEYWGWPNGVAVATQVSKQADVAMLLWAHGHLFDRETQRVNYEYYEPRCSHGSSLSHAAFGMIAARVGHLGPAYEHFRETATVDLLNTQHSVVGGTFIGGIHTAACAGTYQLAVQGFGGLSFADGRLQIDPALPPQWSSLSYPLRWRDHRLRVVVAPDRVEVAADPINPGPVSLVVRGEPVTVEPGGSVPVEMDEVEASSGDRPVENL